jgi:hypothetical protein
VEGDTSDSAVLSSRTNGSCRVSPDEIRLVDGSCLSVVLIIDDPAIASRQRRDLTVMNVVKTADQTIEKSS